MSAPHLQQPGSEQLVQGLEDLQRFRRWDQTLRNLHKTSRASWSERRDCHVSVVEQIFTFVAGSPDEAVRKFDFVLFCCFTVYYLMALSRYINNRNVVYIKNYYTRVRVKVILGLRIYRESAYLMSWLPKFLLSL